jgi:hypothetical protein
MDAFCLMQDFLLKQMTSKGVLRGGTLTIVDVTEEWSEPQQLGTSPARGWITRLPNTDLAPLALGETVGVGSLTEFTRADSDRVPTGRGCRLRPVPPAGR